MTAQKPRTSRLAIAGILLAVFFWPLGFIVSIVALIRILKREDELGGLGLAIGGIVLSVIFIVFSGILAAIAIPNIIKFKCRSMQSEGRTALKSLYIAEESFRAEHNRYASLEELSSEGAMLFSARRYELSVEVNDAGFTGKAVGKKDAVKGDIWTITQDNVLNSEHNACQ